MTAVFSGGAIGNDCVPGGELGSYLAGSEVVDIDVQNGMAYILRHFSASDAILDIVDVHDPSGPVLINSFQFASFLPLSISVIDHMAYATGVNPTLTLIDVSDPASPGLVGSIAFQLLAITFASDFALSGTTGYLAFSQGEVLPVDLADPANPVFMVGLPADGADVIEVVVLDNKLYASGDDRLKIFDISNPANIVPLGTFVFPAEAGYVGGLDVVGTTVFVNGFSINGFNSGLWIIDASDPTSPQLLNNFPEPLGVESVDVVGSTAYLTLDNLGGLLILDVTDPTNPATLGSIGSVEQLGRVVVLDDVAYVAASGTGMSIFDVHNQCADCPPDMNQDGALDFFDIAAFLTALSSQQPASDFNGDGGFDFFDIVAFLGAFSAGCP